MTKTRKDNDVIDRTGLLYAKNKIKLLCRSDGLRSMMKTRQDINVIDFISVVYDKIGTKLLWTIG